MKIKIWKTEQDGGGYMFNIWRNPDASDDDECDDGGQCTGTYKEAIEMAASQARDLLDLQ